MKDFENYGDLGIIGVEMPEIKIQDDSVKASSNLEFLHAKSQYCLKQKSLFNIQYLDRLEYEIKMLDELKYVDYVLAVWDICNFADKAGIPRGPGRGSAAGSLVLYALGVTDVDPVRHDLYFERFVSKARAKFTEVDGITYFDGSLLCDVDLDFDYNRRGEVIDYINKKYAGQTAHILTINTLSGKLVIKETMKIAGNFHEEDANEISDSIPKEFGNVKPLDVARKESEKFDNFCTANPNIYKIARKLEDLNKNFGVHPSGIAIAAHQIRSVMPIQKTKKGKVVTGADMKWVSDICVKFDILGLRTLSVIEEACRLAGVSRKSLTVDHPSIYAALQILDSPKGIFQIEADTQYSACKRVKPANINELADLMALARPGAMDYIDEYCSIKNGEIKDYGHEKINQILEATHGIPIFQEQMMKLGFEVFGLSKDEAETLRRIVGKKKVKEMPVWKDRIYENCERLGLDKKLGDFYWKILEDSANYSFNASHAFSYAYLAAWTIFLKFNHPQEFYCALLKMAKHEQDSQGEVSLINYELKNFNMKLLAPDLIKSEEDFSVDGKDIRYGLSSIKGLNQKTMGPLSNFKLQKKTNKYEVFAAASECKLNIGALASLIQSGVLNSLGANRPRMVLESQAFNVLTDREKRIVSDYAEKYNFDLLQTISDLKGKVASDGRVFMPDSRWATFKEKFDKYKEIYTLNSKHRKFADWWFEKQLLGYSYSQKLHECFQESSLEDIQTVSHAVKDMEVKFVGACDEVTLKKSLKGNRFLRLAISDESGVVSAILSDSPKNQKLTDYINKGGVIPSKKSVVSILGKATGDGSVFIQKISLMDEKIYMKLSEVK